MDTEEKRLEASIHGDDEFRDFMRAFSEARMALYQRQGGTIMECDRAAYDVLRRHFILRSNAASYSPTPPASPRTPR